MSATDPIDQFIPDLRAILRRIYDAGGDAALQRLMFLARQLPAGDLSGRPPAPEPVLPGIAVHEQTQPKAPGEKHAYGVVRNALRGVFRDNRDGLTRQQVGVAAQASRGVQIGEGTLKTTLKVMVRKHELVYRDGNFFPGPKLQASQGNGALLAPRP